jgi:hypothetical protein
VSLVDLDTAREDVLGDGHPDLASDDVHGCGHRAVSGALALPPLAVAWASISDPSVRPKSRTRLRLASLIHETGASISSA